MIGDPVADVDERPAVGERAALAHVAADRARARLAEAHPPPVGLRVGVVAAKLEIEPLALEHGSDQLREAARDDDGPVAGGELVQSGAHLDVGRGPPRHLRGGRPDRADLGRKRLAVGTVPASQYPGSQHTGVAECPDRIDERVGDGAGPVPVEHEPHRSRLTVATGVPQRLPWPRRFFSRPRRLSMSAIRLTLVRALAVVGPAVAALAVAATGGAHISRTVQTDDAAPVWSPDGKTIAFAGHAGTGNGGNWQIYTVKPTGGSRRALTSGDLDSIDLAWSPDGKHIAFSRVTGGQVITDGHVYVMNAGGGGLRRLTSGGGGYDELFNWSPDGKRLAFDRITDGIGAIYVMNANGSDQKNLTPSPSDDDYWAVWSPDGTKIAFDRTGGSAFGDIWVMRSDGSGQKRLTATPADDFGSAWSPDGTKIAYMSNRTGRYQIYVMSSNGTAGRRLSHTAADAEVPRWSPDGKKIAYQAQVGGNYEIFVVGADGSGTRQLTNVAFDNTDPAWSPDGQKIAFLSKRDGGDSVYVMNVDGSSQKRIA